MNISAQPNVSGITGVPSQFRPLSTNRRTVHNFVSDPPENAAQNALTELARITQMIFFSPRRSEAKIDMRNGGKNILAADCSQTTEQSQTDGLLTDLSWLHLGGLICRSPVQPSRLLPPPPHRRRARLGDQIFYLHRAVGFVRFYYSSCPKLRVMLPVWPLARTPG